MRVIHTIAELKELLQQHRQEGKTIGFVPTMGALHKGHITLVERCVAENDICVVSIFVNPTQFNNHEDLRLYPRTPEEDYELLRSTGTDVVFAPSVEEIYPGPDIRIFDFGLLDKVMEGAFRPGHFNGVAQVVSKLFAFVEPHKAYFGEKDFQQLAIVREMVKQQELPVEIVGVPTVREQNGLAMSSRNQRLSVEQREHASEIHRIMRESTLLTEEQSPDQIIHFVTGSINNVPDLRVEYFGIVDGDSLQPVSTWQDSGNIVGAIAVYCGDVRLIDNIRYR
ncbi:pantoate--beta-alanine ligase [Proteiniphilum acetatigenes]|uniref:pantoate--beta-alanine ligase n=1 Tax=Proteiniphilum acetatigenes TaxID=294710 RepID=UPI0003739C26|nr:pantoate--beta-alanine ligase [Proteiniphilum acetatigenes]SDZ79384.1 pantothenate synthetase [Porphyromonadaceae bacterium KH3R12]SFL04804.1 pantothenate synthetase [Porphyromonadaceae bacterium KH3CP3RA]SFS85058.1 pantothenate synthetase [Porphyromonadaceae bacterium NLAE-zl-C104]